ncbi:MAG: S8 family peptidase [Steroidobacteraceae bacterium]
MRRALGTLALSCSLAAGCTTGAAVKRGASVAPDSSDRYVLVMAADDSIHRPDLRGARSGAYRQPRRYPGLPSDIARAMKQLAEEYQLRHVDHWPMSSLGVHCIVFEALPDARMEALVAQLAADPRVESAQRMNRFELRATAAPGIWNDPHRALQRSLDELGVTEVHRWSTGQGVRVAVVDTGVAATHPDLAGQVAERRDFIGSRNAGDRHGTAVAGIIAAKAGNRLGIVGIAPRAKLLALKACEQQDAGGRGSCTTFNLARAIDYAIGADTDVLNLSLGGPHDRLIEQLLSQAIERNIVVIAAAGEDDASFPSNLDDVIAVSGDRRKPSALTLFAPGTDVLSLAPPDGYDYFSGNSIAAAQVSGIVALLREREPSLRAPEIRRILVETAAAGSGKSGEPAPRVVSACAALAQVGREVHCSGTAAETRAADIRAGSATLKTH